MEQIRKREILSSAFASVKGRQSLIYADITNRHVSEKKRCVWVIVRGVD